MAGSKARTITTMVPVVTTMQPRGNWSEAELRIIDFINRLVDDPRWI